MKIYVKKVDGVSLPQKGTEVAAGYDIVATSDPKIIGNQESGGWSRIDYIELETNLFIAPSAFTFHTLIHPRSSISKYNLVLANSIGLIDNDYRGMVICRFKYIWQPEDWKLVDKSGVGSTWIGNPNLEKIYKKGDKIAQLVVEQTVGVEWELVDDLTQTQRGAGGFGSTDISGDVITISKSNKNILPKEVGERERDNTVRENNIAEHAVSNLTELYQKAGGIPIKERYIDEVKKRKE
jgi:dUTP pyrophosphatase